MGSAPGLRRWRAAFARRARPGRAGPGWVRGGRRRSPAGPFANDLRPLAPSAESSARITRPLAGIGRKRPAPVASCNSNPGRSGVRPGGCRRIFDRPGPRRPAHQKTGLEHPVCREQPVQRVRRREEQVGEDRGRIDVQRPGSSRPGERATDFAPEPVLVAAELRDPRLRGRLRRRLQRCGLRAGLQ